METIITKYVIDTTDWDRVAEKMGFVLAKEEALQKEINQTTVAVKSETAALAAAATAAVNAGDKAENGFKKAGTAARDAGGRFKKAGEDAAAGAKKAEGGFKGLAGVVGNLQGQIIAAFSIGAVVAFGSKVIQATANNEKMNASFTVMLKSKAQADILMGQLATFAATTPFELTEVQEATKKLLAFGVAAGQIKPALLAIGDISAAVGAPISEIAELYGKARVQGRLFQEDINQLTGRGIPIIQELAKQFGVTDGEVKKLVETGKVGFKNLETAFKDLTSEGGKFYGLMQTQSETLGGGISNLSDNFDRFFVTLGKANSGVLKDTVNLMSTLISRITRTFANIEDLATEEAGDAISNYTTTITPIFEKIAKDAEKSGADVNAALQKQAEQFAISSKANLERAEKDLKEMRLKWDPEGKKQTALRLIAPSEAARIKSEFATATAAVKTYRGQMEAVQTVIKEVTEARKKEKEEIAAGNKLTDAQIKKLQQLREQYERLTRDLAFNKEESRINLAEAILGEKSPETLEARAKLIKEKLIAQFAAAAKEIREAGKAAGVAPGNINAKVGLLNGDLENQLKTIDAQTAATQNELAKKAVKFRLDVATGSLEQTETMEKTALQDRYNREISNLTEMGQQKLIGVEEYETRKKEIEDRYRREGIEAEIKYLQNKLNLPGLDPKTRGEFENQIVNKQKEIYDLDAANYEAAQKKKTDAAAISAKEREEIERAATQAIGDIGNALFEINANARADELGQISALREAELILAGDNKNKQAQINAEFAQKEKQLRIQQAKAERDQALFNIALNTAAGVASVLSTGGGTRYADFGISAAILSGIVIATGLAQAAAVMSRPLPRFKDGVSFLEGPGTGTSDSIPAYLSRGERVVTAKDNNDYYESYEAIKSRVIPPDVLKQAIGNFEKFGDFRGPKIDLNGGVSIYADQKELINAVNSLPERMPKGEVKLDKSGFSYSLITGQNRRTDLNNRYQH